MTIARFPHGVSSFGIPVLGAGPIVTTGNVFFVDDSGSDNNSGEDPSQPFATLDYAIGRCTASQGDTIVLMPGHAETTTAIAVDVAGVRIVGLGIGADRPTLTATTASTDLINITAAGCTLENFRLVGAASGVTALVDVAANTPTFINMHFEQAATPLLAVTIASGIRGKFIGCYWTNSEDAADMGVKFENTTANAVHSWEFYDCVFNYALYGVDLACIGDVAASCNSHEGGIINNCLFAGCVATAIDFNSSSSASVRGMISNCSMTGFGALTIANVYDLGSYGAVNVLGTDAIAASSPNAIPATTAS